MKMLYVCAALLVTISRPCTARRFRNGPAGRSILLEVEDVLGKDVRHRVESRATRLEETLSKSFMALPKNERGAVRASAARYALHRLFVQLHGWQMKGLELRGDSWHHNSPMEAFGRRVPTRLYSLLHDRLENHGLDLLDLSIMGALLENIVHSEVESRFNITLKALRLNTSVIDRKVAFNAMETYLATYIIGRREEEEQLDEKSAAKLILFTKAQMDRGLLYTRWGAAKDLLEKAADEITPEAATFETTTILAVLEKVADQFFHLENEECRSMRDKLVVLEDHEGTGRVPLGEFYRPTMRGGVTPTFSESEGYLAGNGALDETDAQMQRVLISNYVLLDSNCLASSGYYSVCCIDECEGLMTQLETKLQAPTAEPSELLRIIPTMTVPTVSANYSIIAEHERRLQDIAEHHDGKVPLHGRLFAQWMHHLFPRTCPFPHEAGAIVDVDHRLEATVHDMRKHVAVVDALSSKEKSRDEVLFGMWSAREDLVEPKGHKHKSHGGPLTTVLMFMAALIGAAVTLAKFMPKKGQCKMD